MSKIYDWMMRQAEGKNATLILFIISFIESSFFPFPPDPILAVVVAKNKHRTIQYALLCTLASVLGGFLGYYIGYACFEMLGQPILHFFNITPDKFTEMVQEMGRDMWAFWIICLKGLTPIPFKIVTIASGFAHVNLYIFAIASIIARSFRFLLLSFVCKRYGDHVLNFMEKHKGATMFFILIVVALGFGLLKLLA